MKRKTPFIIWLAAVLTLGGGMLQATDYYWALPPEVWGDFDDVKNWRVGSESGEVPQNPPGENDVLKSAGVLDANGGNQVYTNYCMNLGGVERFLNRWSPHDVWRRGGLSITNGTLAFVNGSTIEGRNIDIYKDATLKYTAGTLKLADGDGAAVVVRVHDGGSYILENEVDLEAYRHNIEVAEGGYVSLGMRSLKLIGAYWNSDSTYTLNGGEFVWPVGVSLTGSDGDTSRKFDLVQNAGTMTLGGTIDKGTTVATTRYMMNGGVLHATADSTIALGTQTIASDASVEINVDENCIFDVRPFTIGENARIRKTGSGTIAVSTTLPNGLSIEAGGIALVEENAPYDLSSMELPQNGCFVRVGVVPVTIRGEVSENLTFVADLNSVAVDVPFVTCEDTTVLEKIKNDLNQNLPKGRIVSVSGSSLIVEVQSSYVFNSRTVDDLNKAEGWVCQVVPTGEDVYIQGEGVRAVITGAFPSFDSITIMDGAELVVNVGEGNACALPKIVMTYASALTIESGNVTFANGFSAQAIDLNFIPQLTVVSGAKLSVDDDDQLSNINLTLSGTLEHLNGGNLILGTAAAGQTGYFGLTADGATFILQGVGSKIIKIACPDEGGKVFVPQEMTVQNSSFSCPADSRYFGIHLGVNNPTDNPVALAFENTSVGTTGDWVDTIGTSLQIEEECKIGGAAVLTLGAGCKWQTHGGIVDWSTYSKGGFIIEDRGQLCIKDGAFFKHHHNATPNTLNPDEDGFPSVVVSNGGILQMGRCGGNGKGVYQINNGVVRFQYHQGFENYKDTSLFQGAKAIEVPEGSTATLCGVVNLWRWHAKSLTNNVPFIGEGNVVITNDVSHVQATKRKEFLFCQAATNSTLTGTLTVANDVKASVMFLDGANWAGAVVCSGNVNPDHYDVALGYKNAGDDGYDGNARTYLIFSPVGRCVTNAYEKLVLNADWPMAVTEEGFSDFLAMGAGGFSGSGRLVFPEDANYAAFEKLVFGSAPSAEMPLPRVKAPGRKVALKAREDGTYDLVLAGAGFSVILR